MFVVSDTSKLRVYVNVPQNYVPSIRVGTKAQIVGSRISGPDISGDRRSSAQSVDVASSTTRMLLVVDNSRGEADDRRLRQCQLRPAASRGSDERPGERADFQPKRAACRDRRQRRRVRAQGGHDRRAIWARRSRSAPALPAHDRVVDIRPTASRRREGAHRRRSGKPGDPRYSRGEMSRPDRRHPTGLRPFAYRLKLRT